MTTNMTKCWDGKIWGVKFWNKVLSYFEIVCVYRYGEVPDYMDVYEMQDIRNIVEGGL